ncbi:MAG: iron-sulfur cluster repair di-iron protein [Bryobacterales bacterium]|nr:iron-sulfur cluster repair di-iron protein [Bryobacterales bacterium]
MTTTLEQTVGEIAAQSADAVRVFEKLGIDYCCGGKRTLGEVCVTKGLEAQQVLDAIAASGGQAAEQDWRKASLRDLTSYIVAKHHEFLRSEMPLLSARLQKVVQVHGEKDSRLQELRGVFEDLRDELDMHMHKEEMILFPYIEHLEGVAEAGVPLGDVPFGSVGNPIRMMEHEHESAGRALERIRQLTNGFVLPEFACATVRALWQGLDNFEKDLHQHIHLENNILHLRAIELESQLS